MAPMTLRSLERGGSGVTIGAYLSVMQVLGMEKDLDLVGKADPMGRELQDARLPLRIKAIRPPSPVRQASAPETSAPGAEVAAEARRLIESSSAGQLRKLFESLPSQQMRRALEALPATRLRKALEALPGAQVRRALEAMPGTQIPDAIEALPETQMRKAFQALPETQMRKALAALPEMQLQQTLAELPSSAGAFISADTLAGVIAPFPLLGRKAR